MKEVRVQSQLERVLVFKDTVKCSGWYYNVIQRMISEGIHTKPLAKFVTGKTTND
jgi:hypothetical protein